METFEYFCALEFPAEVIFLTDMPKLDLMSRTYGPFTANLIYEIPLYCAIELHKTKIVNICTPHFLRSDYLKNIIKEEESQDDYCRIEEDLFLLYELFIKYSYDIEEGIRPLINKIRELRLAKTMAGLKYVDGSAISMNNLTEYEFKQVKDYMVSLMERVDRIRTD